MDRDVFAELAQPLTATAGASDWTRHDNTLTLQMFRKGPLNGL